jgi:hypothetical protein
MEMINFRQQFGVFDRREVSGSETMSEQMILSANDSECVQRFGPFASVTF